MRRARRSDIDLPLVKPSGEVVYEFVGAPTSLGGAAHHSVAEIVIRPGGCSRPHAHLRSEETYYVLRGEGRLTIDGREHRVQPGDAVWIEPGERHQIVNDRHDDLVFLAVSAPPWSEDDSVFDTGGSSTVCPPRRH